MQHEIQLYRASPIACNAPSSDEYTQTEDNTVEQLREQLHLLNQQLQQEKSENQKCRRQIADHLQDRRQLMSQVEELETRCKDSDSVAFALETKNASLETLIESLRHENSILSESVDSLTAAASAAATANAVVTAKPKEKILFITKENRREGKQEVFQFHNKRFSLGSLLFVVSENPFFPLIALTLDSQIAILQTSVWTLLIACFYYYLQTIDVSLYIYRVTS